ncbi:response regulator transcription factor [Deminuibacter soli]|uniref:DNA-binding response regulator n=1 Tax=Deminuibacter soli TaxID=2291815 RepID=A0A3E1NI60_9BACT|nr:response regulator transcription factor [Deminuibacter soli]RFM27625.1 DNA-binding response regulator [Deminuibacter soli]
MQYSVVIADDHLLIAEAIKAVINQFPDYRVLYQVANGMLLTEQFAKQPRPDIVLLDINMPVMNGFETAAWLTKHYPHIKILALSMRDDEKTLIRMLRNGAKGYLLKNTRPDDLHHALDELVQQGFYYPDWIARKMLQGMFAGDSPPEEKATALNDREILFLEYAATELTYKEIAEKMYCSHRTVEGYRDTLFIKLGIKTRVGLVMYALKEGITKI